MTQTVVNFLVTSGTVSSPTYSIQPRIFDFEISADAQAYYEEQMKRLNDLFNQSSLSDADIVEISQRLNQLNEWSKLRQVQGGVQGYLDDGTFVDPTTATNPPPPTFIPSSPSTFTTTLHSTMDSYMAESLDAIIRTIRSAGWDPILGAANATGDVTTAMRDAVNKLIDATSSGPGVPSSKEVFGIAGTFDPSALQYTVNGVVTGVLTSPGLIARARSAAAQARIFGNALTQSDSLQQLLMVDYVSRGNEILFNEMSKLRDAINVNDTALSYLNSLQDLMNQKDPQQFILQLNQLSGIQTSTAPQAAVDSYENATYNKALQTVAKFASDGGDLKTFLDGITSDQTDQADPNDPIAKGAFQDLTGAEAIQAALTSIASYSKTRIIDNLDYLINTLGANTGGDSTGLTIALTRIKNDFSNIAATDAIKTWVQDTQQGSEGDYQRHLSDAITASQSFNDTQREQLRSVMFTFEEFYKSATGLLSRMTQIIEKMAGAIAR